MIVSDQIDPSHIKSP